MCFCGFWHGVYAEDTSPGGDRQRQDCVVKLDTERLCRSLRAFEVPVLLASEAMRVLREWWGVDDDLLMLYSVLGNIWSDADFGGCLAGPPEDFHFTRVSHIR